MKHPAETGELEAFRDLYAAAPAGLGAETMEIGGAFCYALRSAPTSAMFNRVLGLGLAAPATDVGLAAIGRFFAERGVSYGIGLHPDAQPGDLPRRLEQLGLRTGYAWAKFERPTDAVPEVRTELRVERVAADRAADFASVFVRAYGTPPFFEPWLVELPDRAGWDCFVAYAGDEPAATGAVFTHAGVGWLGMAGTLQEHRRKGAQSAILAARIEAARDAGCDVVVTETGALEEGRPSNSYRNIVRAGFEEVYVRPNYLSSPAADTSGTSS